MQFKWRQISPVEWWLESGGIDFARVREVDGSHFSIVVRGGDPYVRHTLVDARNKAYDRALAAHQVWLDLCDQYHG